MDPLHRYAIATSVLAETSSHGPYWQRTEHVVAYDSDDIESKEEFLPKRTKKRSGRPKPKSKRVREPRSQRSTEEDAYNHMMNNAFDSLFPNF